VAPVPLLGPFSDVQIDGLAPSQVIKMAVVYYGWPSFIGKDDGKIWGIFYEITVDHFGFADHCAIPLCTIKFGRV
jgi:hypothetical protein